jgi:DNA invertase Pin-like site-specific DNA recombinase
MTGERAVAIERVSTRRQTPGLQSPELAERAKGRGYDLQRTFTLSVSARKGKQQAVLDAILEGARQGAWSVVLCVAIDRIERRGVWVLRKWITNLYDAGCRVESTSPGEEWLADTSKEHELIWSIRLDLEADRARREAELRAERTARGHRRKDELGQGRIKLPLGYGYEKKGKFDSRIVVDDPAMAVVREAFRLAAEGATLQGISREMKRMGYGRTPEMIGMLLRMPCYSTGELYVPVPVSVDPAVRPEVQQQAVAAIEARRRMTGPRNRNVNNAADFAGRIFCYEHLAPLHRHFGPPHKDGTRVRYYRARAGGVDCGCGMFNADEVDALVDMHGGWLGEPETEMVVTGDSSQRLADIEREMNRVYHKKPDGWLRKLGDLEAEQERLQNAVGGWERRETGRLMGKVWEGMTIAEKRRYLERQIEAQNWRLLVDKGKFELNPDGGFYDRVETFVSMHKFGMEHIDRESRRQR